MKIAFVGGFAFSPKGTIRARTQPLAAELVREGHEVTIFLPPYDNVADLAREWEQDGVHIRNMGGHDSGGRVHRAKAMWRLAPSLVSQLIGEVTRYQPDVIHIVKPKGFAGAVGTYFLVKGFRNVVLDCDDWEGWGGWNDVKQYSWLVKEYIHRQERWMLKSAPAVTVASRTLEDRARTIRGRKDAVYYIPNCGAGSANNLIRSRIQSVSQSDMRRLLGLPDRLTVLYAAHSEEQPSTDFFWHAAAPLIEKHQACFAFVGDEPELHRMRQLCTQRPNITGTFFPTLPYQEFLQLVSAADIAAFPYPNDFIHRAKCSARMIDYMALGKAVLTSGVGQNSEYIIHGHSGLLAQPGDHRDFADCLELLLRNPQLRARLGKEAQARIHKKFRWDGEPLQQCLAAYERVLQAA